MPLTGSLAMVTFGFFGQHFGQHFVAKSDKIVDQAGKRTAKFT